MKLTIYGHEEEPVRLKLHLCMSGIELVAVDSTGAIRPGGYILTITSEGTVELFGDIASDLGFQLDGRGRIKVIP